jgi:hypothetical protein
MAHIEVVEIKSNTDRLSDRAVHDTLVNFVRNEALMGEISLKALVPKRTLDMMRAAGHKGPYDMGAEIEAAVGIPEIHKDDESSPFSAKYPIFTDKGTGIFAEHGSIFAKEHETMYIPESRGIPGFLRESKGQPGREFMMATFSTMIAMLKINGEVWRTELTSRLKTDQII